MDPWFLFVWDFCAYSPQVYVGFLRRPSQLLLNWHLCANISRIRPFLPTEATRALVHFLAISIFVVCFLLSMCRFTCHHSSSLLIVCVSVERVLLEETLRDVGFDERDRTLLLQHWHHHTVLNGRIVQISQHAAGRNVALHAHKHKHNNHVQNVRSFIHAAEADSLFILKSPI